MAQQQLFRRGGHKAKKAWAQAAQEGVAPQKHTAEAHHTHQKAHDKGTIPKPTPWLNHHNSLAAQQLFHRAKIQRRQRLGGSGVTSTSFGVNALHGGHQCALHDAAAWRGSACMYVSSTSEQLWLPCGFHPIKSSPLQEITLARRT